MVVLPGTMHLLLATLCRSTRHPPARTYPARWEPTLPHPLPACCLLSSLKAYSLTSFIVSMLLSQRLGRAYDRWNRGWAAFAALGRAATLELAQEAAAATEDEAVQVGRAVLVTSG